MDIELDDDSAPIHVRAFFSHRIHQTSPLQVSRIIIDVFCVTHLVWITEQVRPLQAFHF